MNRYAAEAQATIIGVPTSMWRKFGVRGMPTLKAYNSGKSCPAIRGRDGRSFKHSLDNCGGTPQPTPRPTPTARPTPTPRPTPQPSGGSVRWDTKSNHFIIQNSGNFLRSCPRQQGYQQMNTRGGPLCARRSNRNIANEAKQDCAADAQCKALVHGQCRG
jgi:hypothetical protein